MPGVIDTAIIAAVVSAAVTALGWFASHWSESRLESLRRAEKIVDVQTALLAEIESNLSRYAEIDLDAHAGEMDRKILASRTRFTPFVPRDITENVFEAFLADIHILPTITIRDVVAYYKQEYKLRELVNDLRSDRYERLSQVRKARIYADYIWQIKTVLTDGEMAIATLSQSLGIHAPSDLSSRVAVLNPASGNP